MNETDLGVYLRRAKDGGVTDARLVNPATVVTAPWVRLKCQFGCPGYDRSYCCPPHTPRPEEMRGVIDSYRRAILFQIEAPKTEGRGQRLMETYRVLTDLEGDMFKDGYYRALVFLSGPCRLCKECAYLRHEPCAFRDRARPSMEACGIDVYQTARTNGFFIEPLRDRSQTQNHFCMMLVD